MRTVHAGAERGQDRSCFPGLFLFDLTTLIVTVALAQVVKAKVLDLVTALALRAAFWTLLAFCLLFVLKAKEFQLGLRLGLLGLCLCGSEPAERPDFMCVEGFVLLLPAARVFLQLQQLCFCVRCLCDGCWAVVRSGPHTRARVCDAVVCKHQRCKRSQTAPHLTVSGV